MSATPTLQRALYFAEGTFLMMKQGGVYFLPHGHRKAYSCRGEEKDLFGKTSHTMTSTNKEVGKFTLTYEFEGDTLIAARLITQAGRSKGTALPKASLAMLDRQLQDGSMTLVRPVPAPALCSVSRLPDGQFLLHVQYLPGHQDMDALLLGTPGAYRTLEIAGGIQGGNSHYFTLTDGTRVELPRAFGGGTRPGEFPKFGADIITYLPQEGGEKDFVTYGLAIEKPAPHLDPFSPELKRPAPRGPAPKGP